MTKYVILTFWWKCAYATRACARVAYARLHAHAL